MTDPTSWWKEYPERDTEYVRWYPPKIHALRGEEVWNGEEVSAPEEFGVYVHIPYCEALCPFCPYSKSIGNARAINTFVNVLRREIALYADRPYLGQGRVAFIYFGGGTPSILPVESFAELIGDLRAAFTLHEDVEITVEANPGTTTGEKLCALRRMGVNRVSFGIQSFNDRFLRLIGTHHSSRHGLAAITGARQAGFENVGIDLMFRLPGQTMADWLADLDMAIEAGVEHISCYSMFLDSESRLTQLIHGGKVPPQPEEEVDIMMSQTALAYLGKAGYRHYASCASCGYDLAQPGKECVYEYRHWAAPQIEYLGLGAGAFSFIRGHIYCNLSTVEAYSALVRKGHFPVVAGKKLTLADKMSRYMVLGAKCLAVETSPFEERFGLPLRQVFQEPLQRLSAWGLVEDDGSTIRVTERGKLYGDNISKAFYDKAYYLMPHPLEPDIQKLSEQQPVAASQDLVSV